MLKTVKAGEYTNTVNKEIHIYFNSKKYMLMNVTHADISNRSLDTLYNYRIEQIVADLPHSHSLQMFLSCCGLFNDAISSSVYTASNDTVTNDWKRIVPRFEPESPPPPEYEAVLITR
jgi:hypothetical protein